MIRNSIIKKLAFKVPKIKKVFDQRDTFFLKSENLIQENEKLGYSLSDLRKSFDDLAVAHRILTTSVVDYSNSHNSLIEYINNNESLNSPLIRRKAREVEIYLLNPLADKIKIHREIGMALFNRSPNMYDAANVPKFLRRFTYPPFLALLVNTHCNAACFFCRDEHYQGTSLPFSEIDKFNSAITNARVVDLTGWGEPFLYPEFENLVDHILEINNSPQLIQLTTNGSLLSRKWGSVMHGNIHKLIISINAATSETYKHQMRYKNERFTFEKVIQNISDFMQEISMEDKLRIEFNMVTNTDNYKEIPDLVELASKLGISQVNIGYYICNQPEFMNKTLWNIKEAYNEIFTNAKIIADKLGVRLHGKKFFENEISVAGSASCVAPFESIFIESSGKTAPCCFFGNTRFENALQDGFEAIWFSKQMNALRKSRSLDPCQICTIFSPFDEKNTHISASLHDLAQKKIIPLHEAKK